MIDRYVELLLFVTLIATISLAFFTTKKKGSGLGVSLSKEIIEQHGGNIVYNSVKGEGTRVIVTLPKEINMA